MTEPATLREEVVPADEAAVRALVAATRRFSPAELEVAAELVRERLGRGEASGYRFLLAERDGRVLGYACYGAIAGTAGSYDLYWIVVHPAEQGRGLGRCLLREVEQRVSATGARRVYAETSARSDYAPTRAFYAAAGYHCEATLRDFYAPGDHKVVYVKVLSPGR